MSATTQLHDLVSNAPLTCHQLPERSFRFKNGTYFPVCARCTGVFTGQMFALLFVVIHGANLNVYFFLFGLPMLVDWLVQYRGWQESTNLRRVITGSLGGFGLGILYYSVAVFGIEFLLKLTKLV